MYKNHYISLCGALWGCIHNSAIQTHLKPQQQLASLYVSKHGLPSNRFKQQLHSGSVILHTSPFLRQVAYQHAVTIIWGVQ
jgi:hypothetical protein